MAWSWVGNVGGEGRWVGGVEDWARRSTNRRERTGSVEDWVMRERKKKAFEGKKEERREAGEREKERKYKIVF